MNVEETGQKAKERKLCFKCLSDAHQAKNCTGTRCNVNICGKSYHRLLYRLCKTLEQKQSDENDEEVSNLSSMRSSGVLPVIPVTISSRRGSLQTLVLCSFGASVSFMDESFTKASSLTGKPVDLKVGGIHGTSDISSRRLRFKIGDQEKTVGENIVAYSHPNVNAGNLKHNYRELKKTYPHLLILKYSIINLEDIIVMLGQDCYHLKRANECLVEYGIVCF